MLEDDPNMEHSSAFKRGFESHSLLQGAVPAEDGCSDNFAYIFQTGRPLHKRALKVVQTQLHKRAQKEPQKQTLEGSQERARKNPKEDPATSLSTSDKKAFISDFLRVTPQLPFILHQAIKCNFHTISGGYSVLTYTINLNLLFNIFLGIF